MTRENINRLSPSPSLQTGPSNLNKKTENISRQLKNGRALRSAKLVSPDSIMETFDLINLHF